MNNENCRWGGKRQCAGRKKTCVKKVPFNRRINEDILNILREYAKNHDITETEALESAILLQTNIEKIKGGKIMKIAVPTLEGRLCSHFGHCETFSFVEVNKETKEIMNIETGIPEEGITCQSANWIASKGVSVVLAGGMGGRPLSLFAQNGVQVILGCPEIEINDIVNKYLNDELVSGENSCGHDAHHTCHGGNGEGHQHHGNH